MTRLILLFCLAATPLWAALKAGVAAVPVTPYGENPDWRGPVQPNGVWGDDAHKIWLAGFGSNRPATAKHDDLWARALVLESGRTKVALVALDFIGYYQNADYYGVDQVKKLLKPGLNLTEIIVASTHNHEGPDTIGLWGAGGKDGKYADYLKFVDRQIAWAINRAADPAHMSEVRARFGTTNPKLSPSLKGLQVRGGHRPPDFFDEELRAMQLIHNQGTKKSQVLATLINWNTHPESMESRNQSLTSDFPHFAREAVEKKYGGTAVYFTGAIGAVEIVGDAVALGEKDYEEIDGQRFPLTPQRRPNVSFERTQAIGEAVAKGVFDALGRGSDASVGALLLKSKPITMPVTNPGYLAMIKAGLLTNFSGDAASPVTNTTLYYLKLGPAEFVTLPGEIFPELIYGAEQHRRTDCPEANTGRPYEPAAASLLKSKYHFWIGLAPDELGYVVPQYDFHPFPPKDMVMGRRAQDPCKAKGVPDHYHETNSVSYRMGPVVACGLVELLGGDPGKHEACK